MTRVLVSVNGAYGHFLPLSWTIRALLASGAEVRVACPAPFADAVSRAGFEAWPCALAPAAGPPPAPADPAARFEWSWRHEWPALARPWVDDLLRRVRAWRPDLVVAEPAEHAARVVAAVEQLPLAAHGWGFGLPAGSDVAATAAIADLYERLGAAPSPPAGRFDLGPQSLQPADAAVVPRYRYRPASLAAAPAPPRTPGRRRALVTLGTYANPVAAARLRTAAAAAVAAGLDVLVVLGHADRGDATGFPAAAAVREWVDMPAAVDQCDVVVHHGGAGLSWTTLLAGLPAVVLPQDADQFRNARLLIDAGVAVPGADLPAALAHVLADPALAERAAALAAANAALPDVDQLAADLLAMT